jgi:hypothetical protein
MQRDEKPSKAAKFCDPTNCEFRLIPATDYARFRPPITVDPGHPLRSIPAAYYGDSGHPYQS